MVINVTSSHFEAKFIKWYWTEFRIEVGFFSYLAGKLELSREWKPGFFNFAVSFNYVKSFRHIMQTFSNFWHLSTYIFRRLSTRLDSVFQKKPVYIFARVEIGNLHWKTQRFFGVFLVLKFQYKEMSDLPKVKIYEINTRIKNHDLPKARVKDKTLAKSLKWIAQSY